MAASPFFLLQEGNRVAADIANLELQQQQQPFRVALLSAENPDYLVEALKKQLAIAAPSRRCFLCQSLWQLLSGSDLKRLFPPRLQTQPDDYCRYTRKHQR
nr:hypothetical protein [Erwinia rhapontici]